MEPIPQVVTGFRGELRILPNMEQKMDTKMELFVEMVKNWKPFTTFAKTTILDVWKGSEYDSELASKVEDVSFLNLFEYQR